MDNLSWIMSEGGPLIIMEKALKFYWGGVFRLTDSRLSAQNDYERLDIELDYIQSISLQSGQALILGDGPLDTAFWSSPTSELFIIRVIYCNPDFDGNAVMTKLDQKLFKEPVETMGFSFEFSDLIMFDSADDGAESNIKFTSTSIEPGCYRISTIAYEPDEFTSLLLHKFYKIT